MNRRSFLSWLGAAPLVGASGTAKLPGPNAGRSASGACLTPTLGYGNTNSPAYELVPLEAHIKQVVNSLDRRNQDPVTGLRSYLRDLDDLTGGLQRSDLILIAGRPSMGKTALALNIACRVAMGGWDPPRAENAKPVLIVSMDEWNPALARNMLCAYAGVDVHRVRRGTLSGQDRRALRAKAADLRCAPIHMIQACPLALEDLQAMAIAAKEQIPGLALVVVDSVQRIEEPSGPGGRPDLALICRGLKGLARMLDVPVVGLSALTRRTEDREGHVPRLSDLPGGRWAHGSADVVILLYRPELYWPGERTGEAELIIAKNRHGPTGLVIMSFQRRCLRFDDFPPGDCSRG